MVGGFFWGCCTTFKISITKIEVSNYVMILRAFCFGASAAELALKNTVEARLRYHTLQIVDDNSQCDVRQPIQLSLDPFYLQHFHCLPHRGK